MPRTSGILMPVFSLPSPYGIGTLGKAAYEFIDFLSEAGQTYWQVLPLGPTSFGDSPYQSFSSFAGNPYFIDLDMLIDDGLLKREEVLAAYPETAITGIDYANIYSTRFLLLEKAYSRGWERDAAELLEFRDENAGWLPSYALFMALKRHFNMQAWTNWDEDIKLRKPEAISHYTELLRADVELFTYIQFLFFTQWAALKKYALEKEIMMIGDVPIYVAMDSADVWSEPEFFLLDEKLTPLAVAGVPPDYFSETGQLWGNPLYDWDKMRSDGWGWWIRRLDGAKKMYEVIRIDHFRGLESYWSVPASEETAIAGKWVKGPGIEFVNVIKGWFHKMPVIAEDLGILTDDVRQLLKDSEYPGMRVLEFAFDPAGESLYLPHCYPENCVCYTGTHDNDTLTGWLESAEESELQFAERYLGLNRSETFAKGIIRGGMCSAAELFVAQMQDWLALGSEARINTPGTVGANWTWRAEAGSFTAALAEEIYEITAMYGRCLRGHKHTEEKISEENLWIK